MIERRKQNQALPALLRGIDSGAQGGATVGSPPVTVAPGLSAGLALALLKSAGNLSVRPRARFSTAGSIRAARFGSAPSVAIPAPVIVAPSPAEGTDTQASYQLQMQASGPALTWSISAGSLPAGLSINAATGLISGSPTAEETANFTVQASNAAGADTEDVEITINAAPEITTTTLTAGTEAEAYTATLVASGGTGTGTWSVQSGALPDGLSLNANTGEISGTPTTVETANFTVRYTDANGVTDDQALSLEIAAAFDMEAWLEGARVYYDPEDGAVLNMSGADLVSIESKGTLDHLLKLVSGAGALGTGGGQQIVDLSGNAQLDVRDAGDTSNINHDGVVSLSASCVLYVLSINSHASYAFHHDASVWVTTGFFAGSEKAEMRYWQSGYKVAQSTNNIPTGTLLVLGFHHDGVNVWVSVNGVAGTPAACGAVGGSSAWALIRLVNGKLGKLAAWNVATPTDFAAGVAALMDHYGIA